MIVEKGAPGSAMGSSNAKGNALAQAVEAAGFACTATPAAFREVCSTPVPSIRISSWEDPLQVLLGVVDSLAILVRSSLLLPSSSLWAEGGHGTCNLFAAGPHCLRSWEFPVAGAGGAPACG